MANLIDSKTKRGDLKPRREPYWAALEKYGYLGYRKPQSGEGTWIARWRDEDGKEKYRALGTFDHFDDAAKAARAWFTANGAGVSHQKLTVQQACADYVTDLKAANRKSTASDAEGRFRRLVDDTKLGKTTLDKLSSRAVQGWLNSQAVESDDDEEVRRSKDYANRNLSSLKAALNAAYKHRLVATDTAWATVTGFKDVDAPRKNAFLSLEQRTALMAACPADLATFVKALLLTGARPGEAAKLKAKDFDKHLGTITLTGKTGLRQVAVSTAAAEFFGELCKSRIGDAVMLPDPFGQIWKKDNWSKPFRAAARKAGLVDDVVLYSIRHTAISEMVLAGIDSFIVAKLTGTSVAMIERHYGHLKHSSGTAILDRVRMV